MKANQFGTTTEKQLFHMGYKTSSQRSQCGNCKLKDITFINPETVYESERYRCKKTGFATTKTAICNEWEAS